MEWFKHPTGSHDDPDVSDAMDEFGHVGYSVFFITLEIYGSEFNHLDSEGWLTLSRRFVARKLRLSQTKVEQILNFYSERQRIITKTSKNTISINCPKFVEIASNWTKRKNPAPTEYLCSASVAPTAIEEEEKKKRIEGNNKPPMPPKKRGDEYEPDFLTFWNTYPKKAKKPNAYREWKKLGSKRPVIGVILSAIKKHATWRPWIEGFIPDPERWLKNERWLDEEPLRAGDGNGRGKSNSSGGYRIPEISAPKEFTGNDFPAISDEERKRNLDKVKALLPSFAHQ